MKTIDEGRVAYIDRPDRDYHASFNKCETKAFLEGINFAQQWISVADELPEENEDVLIKCTNGKRIQHDVDYIFNGKWAHRTNVTHWRPIERK
ncbi:MAG: DUF551 domain-containing protein [Prevotellaceae bacterium]|jgi:hypothetical protein|nr:DUF551 domain-containing protein [Prevotellaceae bacterium]